MAIPLISAAHAGLARTLHMENRIAYGPSIDLQQDGPLPTTATWSALAQNSGEYVIALRGGRAFGLRLMQQERLLPRVLSAVVPGLTYMVAGGTKVKSPASPGIITGRRRLYRMQVVLLR